MRCSATVRPSSRSPAVVRLKFADPTVRVLAAMPLRPQSYVPDAPRRVSTPSHRRVAGPWHLACATPCPGGGTYVLSLGSLRRLDGRLHPRACPTTHVPWSSTMSTKGFFMTSVLRRPPHRTRLTSVLTLAFGLTVGLTVSACSATTSPTAAHETATTATTLSIVDPWVKAADSGMTGVFGTISNTRDIDVRLTTGTSPAAAKVELHEMAADASGTMVMRPKEGGFVVPAHGSLTLSPGGLHIMLMGLTAPVKPGDEVRVTLSADDGTTLDVTAPARSFAGANESYSGTASPMASSMP